MMQIDDTNLLWNITVVCAAVIGGRYAVKKFRFKKSVGVRYDSTCEVPSQEMQIACFGRKGRWLLAGRRVSLFRGLAAFIFSL